MIDDSREFSVSFRRTRRLGMSCDVDFGILGRSSVPVLQDDSAYTANHERWINLQLYHVDRLYALYPIGIGVHAAYTVGVSRVVRLNTYRITRRRRRRRAISRNSVEKRTWFCFLQ